MVVKSSVPYAIVFQLWYYYSVLIASNIKNEKQTIDFVSLKDSNLTKYLPFNENDIIDTGYRERFAQRKGNVKNFYTWTAPHPTIGKPWPKPQHIRQTRKIYRILDNPRFVIEGDVCNLITLAIGRYKEKIFKYKQVTHVLQKDIWGSIVKCRNQQNIDCFITSIHISVQKCSENDWPSQQMNETYTLSVQNNFIRIYVSEVWGLLRALETLSHLVYCILTDDTRLLAINEAVIVDWPRYSYRGLLLDTSRHFIPFDDIISILNGMEMNKLNVFHWHLTDDQSFPFVSDSHPELHQKGAYDLSKIYTHSTIRQIVQYAKERGIRVIPEIDVPGHTASWSKSHPELMSRCVESDGTSSAFGPLNPTLIETFELLSDLYTELVSLFPDEYIHIGMDEVGFNCWNSDPTIKQFMKKHGIHIHNNLTEIFIKELQRIIQVKSPKKKTIVWQEAFESKALLSENTIIQIWKSPIDRIRDFQKSGFPLIYSTDLYLDRIEYGPPWVKFYLNAPTDVRIMTIIGGEACMWTEFQSKETIHQTIWPATSAIASKLWYDQLESLVIVGSHLEEHRCRMLRRGIDAGVASGPSECLYMDNGSSHFHEYLRQHIKIQWPKMFENLKYYLAFLLGLLLGYLFQIVRLRSQQYMAIIVILPAIMIILHIFLLTYSSMV